MALTIHRKTRTGRQNDQPNQQGAVAPLGRGLRRRAATSRYKRLAFGSGITSWRHVEQLQALGITHVINLRFNRHGKKEKSFKVLWIPFRDDKQPRPQWFYRKTWKFYPKAMKQPNSKMFRMCRVGICRSASLAYFLLRGSGMNCEEAHDVVVR